MKLTLLGTGAPAPSAKRAGSGYVVQIAGDTFVFDHGPGAHARMLQAGIPVTDVTQLFLTHFHYDHFTDVASLVLTHMTRQVDADGVRERIVKEIADIYDGRIIVGEDLKTIGTEAPEIGNPL